MNLGTLSIAKLMRIPVLMSLHSIRKRYKINIINK